MNNIMRQIRNYSLLFLFLIFIHCDSMGQDFNSIMDLNIGDSTSIVIDKIVEEEIRKFDFSIDSVAYHVIAVKFMDSAPIVVNTRNRTSPVSGIRGREYDTPFNVAGAKYSPFCLVFQDDKLLNMGFIHELKRSDKKAMRLLGTKLMILFEEIRSKEGY